MPRLGDALGSPGTGRDVAARGPRLGEILMDMGFLEPRQLELALEEQKRTGQRLGAILIDAGWISEARLVRALSRQLGVPTCDPVAAPVHERVRALLPRELAHRLHALPIALKRTAGGDVLCLVTSDPLNPTLAPEIAAAVGVDVELMIAGDTEIEVALAKHYGTAAPAFVQPNAPPSLPPIHLSLPPLTPSSPPVRIVQGTPALGEGAPIDLDELVPESDDRVALMDALAGVGAVALSAELDAESESLAFAGARGGRDRRAAAAGLGHAPTHAPGAPHRASGRACAALHTGAAHRHGAAALRRAGGRRARARRLVWPHRRDAAAAGVQDAAAVGAAAWSGRSCGGQRAGAGGADVGLVAAVARHRHAAAARGHGLIAGPVGVRAGRRHPRASRAVLGAVALSDALTARRHVAPADLQRAAAERGLGLGPPGARTHAAPAQRLGRRVGTSARAVVGAAVGRRASPAADTAATGRIAVAGRAAAGHGAVELLAGDAGVLLVPGHTPHGCGRAGGS